MLTGIEFFVFPTVGVPEVIPEFIPEVIPNGIVNLLSISIKDGAPVDVDVMELCLVSTVKGSFVIDPLCIGKVELVSVAGVSNCDDTIDEWSSETED